MNKIIEFFESKRYFIYGILGALLISMTFKSQIIILSYTDNYSLRMEYTVYGYCIRASAALKATEPAVYNEMYFFNSLEDSILKASKQLQKLGGEGDTVKVMSTGFPRDNEKLEQKIISFLQENGINAEVLQTSENTLKN